MQLRGNKCIGYVALNVTMTTSNDLKCMWKEAVVAHLEYDPSMFGVTEKSHETEGSRYPVWV
jgi:hypothetical protein